ncbi:PREDICTED: uncharacterized protein LOC106298885 isoform X2 [Brassica oleracea var. oleracea]|uniref:uncharacterized protein LOC106298885 isoform X2 n=1 Tax=Brassica oleracea var. oleracea TaxID=109376 RepID=UPI0006A7094D|nr:PREDICTED: uncharacterized protein LOC106298885 isoform X2 [Brassica oleracea var. oleracea]
MGITLLFLDEKFYRCEDPISTINFVFHPQKFRTKETTNQLREPDSKRLIDVIAANGVLFIMAALRIERFTCGWLQRLENHHFPLHALVSSFPIFFLGFLKETNYSGRERIVHRRQLLKLQNMVAVEFPCTGAVVGIYTANGWSKLQCWSLRYRVQMTVSLASDFAEFVAFDSDISKLTNIRAAEISQQMVILNNLLSILCLCHS